MKKYTFELTTVFLIMLTYNLSYAQNKNWQIGMKAIPEWSMFNNNNNPRDSYSESKLKYSNMFLWSGGFQLVKGINKYISIESGINISNKATRMFGYNYNLPVPCIYCRQIAGSNSQEKTYFYHQYSYLNIPLIIKFNIKDFYIGSGLAINKFIFQKTNETLTTYYYPTPKSMEINNWVFDLPVILGYQRKVYRSLNIFLEGRYTPTLSKIYKNSSEKAVNYGFGFGVNWTLEK